MNLHLAFALNSAILAAAFWGGRRWVRMTTLPYHRAVKPLHNQRMELFSFNQAGRVIQYGSVTMWLISAAAYLAILFNLLSE